MNEGSMGSKSTTGGFLRMLDFGFTRFITLQAIKFVYALGLILLVLSWIVFSIGAMSQNFFPGLGLAIVGILVVVIYAVMLRIWLELIAVIFRIGENTSKLVQHMESKG